MNIEIINDRIAQLYLVLQFCSEHTKTFTVGERICINQERFQLIHILSHPDAIPRPVSNVIETKITDTIQKVGMYNFRPLNKNPFLEEIEHNL